MRGDDGLVHLDRFPLFLIARVTGPSLTEPVTESWPDEVPTVTPEEVDLDIILPPGEDHRLKVALLALSEEHNLVTYEAPGPGESPLTARIVSNEETLLDITLTELERGTVNLSWAPMLSVESVAWVDDEAGVRLPPTRPEQNNYLAQLAVGRTYYPEVTLESGEFQAFRELAVTLERQGQVKPVHIAYGE
jgi:hypothetical protein